MKRFIAVLLVFVLSFTMVSFAAPFIDVDEKTEEGQAIVKLYDLGYINGYDERTFAPQNKITRAEFVKIVNRVFSYYIMADNPFNDVKKEDWFYNEICIAVNAGYINGMGNGRFAPDEDITREQALTIVNNILNMEKLPIDIEISDEISDWARDTVIIAVTNGLISLEDGNKLRATEPIKRGETALLLSKCVVDKTPSVNPIDLDSLADDVLAEKMTNIINILKEKTLPLCYLDAQTKVVESIINSMESYLKDKNFDYKTAQKDTYKIYCSMKNRPDRLALQNMISSNMYIDDLLVLYEFFFPDDDMNLTD